jgi:hypothetical protein
VLDVPVHPRDPSGVEGAARSILAQRQFRRPGQNLLVRFFDWVGRELSDLLPSGKVGSLAIPSWVGVLVLAAIVAVVVTVLVRSGAFRGGPKRRRPSPAVHETVDDLDLASDEWLRRAEAAEDGGAWGEGVRCRYRASLAVLATAGAVTERVGRTSGSYLRRVAAAVPAAAAPFAEATDRFERTWYGREPAGAAARDAMVGLHQLIEPAAATYRAAAHGADVEEGEDATDVEGGQGDGGRTAGADGAPVGAGPAGGR